MKALHAFFSEYRRCRRNHRETRWGAVGEGLYMAARNVPGRIPGKLGAILFSWHCRIRTVETKRRHARLQASRVVLLALCGDASVR